MSICYDFVLDLIAAIKNKPYNMNKFAKNGLLSSSLSHLFCYTQRKSTKIIPCASSGAEGETRQGKPCLACFASFPILCPFLLRKKWTIEFETLPFILLYTKKKHKDNSLCFFWRGRRDSNSRAGFPTYALSRGASSPT